MLREAQGAHVRPRPQRYARAHRRRRRGMREMATTLTALTSQLLRVCRCEVVPRRRWMRPRALGKPGEARLGCDACCAVRVCVIDAGFRRHLRACAAERLSTFRCPPYVSLSDQRGRVRVCVRARVRRRGRVDGRARVVCLCGCVRILGPRAAARLSGTSTLEVSARGRSTPGEHASRSGAGALSFSLYSFYTPLPDVYIVYYVSYLKSKSISC